MFIQRQELFLIADNKFYIHWIIISHGRFSLHIISWNFYKNKRQNVNYSYGVSSISALGSLTIRTRILPILAYKGDSSEKITYKLRYTSTVARFRRKVEEYEIFMIQSQKLFSSENAHLACTFFGQSQKIIIKLLNCIDKQQTLKL